MMINRRRILSLGGGLTLLAAAGEGHADSVVVKVWNGLH